MYSETSCKDKLIEHITNRLPVQEGVTSWTSRHKQVFEQVSCWLVGKSENASVELWHE